MAARESGIGRMVGVAQLAERWLVEPEVAGSSPVVHPTGKGRDPRGSRPFRRLRPVVRARPARAGCRGGVCEGGPVLHCDPEDFERLVVDELDELPDEMVDGLDNVVFVVEDRPEDGSLDLLGLYDGVAMTERGQYGFGEMPDRIVVYREPHLHEAEDLDDLRDLVHVTLVHEIAHFHGIDDDRLHELGWA
jgi:predicted Zn-dependent protease with MMP-like domain